VAPRTRIIAFGTAGVLVIAGLLANLVIGGLTGQVLEIAGLLIGLGGALLLIFLEVGLSEDHAREREEELRRAQAAQRTEARRRPRLPRRPRRPG
jgi:hypothetical protein